MLEPARRTLLLDALRPPEGYRLDVAVGTTFSLDLHALLLPPLAFALFDWAAGDDGDSNPLALLEAARRNAERITVFCQAGQIGVPRHYRSVLVYLESCVVEVTAPDRDRIFHPKLWALKFVADGQPTAYRLLCATRNLTFDRAWDTVLVLDGAQARDGAVGRRNRPLQRFLAALPDLAVRRPLPAATRDRVQVLADEFLAVDFDLPEGFTRLAFHPLGLERHDPQFPHPDDRLLVVAPFLTSGTLRRLSAHGSQHVLVSRPESIDAVGAAALERFGQTFVLAPHTWAEAAAEQHDGVPAAATGRAAVLPTDEAVAEAPDVELTGLHAKLFVAQRPGSVRVFTGSANATDAAFHGNVEFLVELETNAHRLQIDRLLQPGTGDGAFRDLLEAYRPANEDAAPVGDEQALERLLDSARRTLAAGRFRARATAGDSGYELVLDAAYETPLQLDAVEQVLCWPVTLGAGSAVAPRVEGATLTASFGIVSDLTVVAFFAFELAGRCGSATDTVRLVVNAELEGGPADRRERVLVDLLRSRSDVLRYLLFLLAAGGVEAQLVADALMREPGAAADSGETQWQIPLLESLVRTLADEPSRLDHLARVIDDLRRAGGDDLLPDGLRDVWEPIWTARQELR